MTVTANHSLATPLLLLLVSLWLTGCAQTAGNARTTTETRQSALDSWHQCLQDDNQSDISLGKTTKIFRQRLLECQGHRFDLLATYPRHLEPSVDRMLIVSARRSLVDQSNASESEKFAARELASALPVRDDWSKILRSGKLPGFNKNY